MRLAFSNGDYFEIQVVVPETAGVAFDCRLLASMRCGTFAGAVEAWVDGGDVQYFVSDLLKLRDTLKGKATLTSEDGRSISMEVAPVDSLGHFALHVVLAKDLHLQSQVFPTSTAGVFPFETEAMASICRSLIDGVQVR